MPTTPPVIIDLFRGPGGWSEGLRLLGLSDYGAEFDKAAHATATANGHDGELVDVTDLEPLEFAQRAADHYGITLEEAILVLIASPPCQTFSLSGKGAGRRALDDVLLALKYVAAGLPFPTRTVSVPILDAETREEVGTREEEVPYFDDVRTALVLIPLKWALELEPDVIIWEQVPPVLPVWEACAEVLRAEGYSVATGIVHAEEHGVPQTRKRAVLVARRHGIARLPRPTHTRYRKGKPRQTGDLLPWVSMGDALDWSEGLEVVSNYGTGGDPANRGVRTGDEPSATITSKASRNVVRFRSDRQDNATVRTLDEPAPTIKSGHSTAERVWEPVLANPVRDSLKDAAWTRERPSPTIVGSFAPDVVAAPGYRKAGDGPRQNAVGSVRVTLEEAAVLQSFPRHYEWKGSKSKREEQVGNAVPPVMAAAIVAEALDLPRRQVWR